MPYVTVRILCAGEYFEADVDTEANMIALAERIATDIADEEPDLLDQASPGAFRLALVKQPPGIIADSTFELVKVPPPQPRPPARGKVRKVPAPRDQSNS